MYVQPTRIKKRLGARPAGRRAIVPPLWGGARGGRKPIYLGQVGLGDGPMGQTIGCGPAFVSYVEAWRSDIQAQAGTLPIDFLLAWVQIESCGSACSDTQYNEVGIFQLMRGDNLARGGTTEEQQHPVPPCVAGTSSHVWRPQLTDDQAYEQVRGGLQYVNYCRTYAEAQLSSAGYLGQPGWTDSDWSYWAMVKMVHVAPAVIPRMLQQGIAGAGGVPADWDDMAKYVTGVPANWLDNARSVGLFGSGGGSFIGNLAGGNTLFIALLAGLGIAAYLLTTPRHSTR